MPPHAVPHIAVSRMATDDGELASWATSVVAATERAEDGRSGDVSVGRVGAEIGRAASNAACVI